MFIIKTDLPRSEALQHIQMFMNAQNRGWALTHKDDASITFTRTGKPDIGTTIILLLLFVLPAILYLIFAWRKETANFFIVEKKDGTSITVEAGLHTKQLGWKLYGHLRKVTATVETTENRWRFLAEQHAALIVIVAAVVIFGGVILYLI